MPSPLLPPPSPIITGAVSALADDFSDATLSKYSQTWVLDNGIAETNVSLSASTGALVSTYGGTINQAELVVLLRDDYALVVGETVTVDVSLATSTSTSDFGIAVAITKTPTSVTVGNLDTRKTFNWAAIYIRPNQNAVRSLSNVGTTLDSGTGGLEADETTVAKLWIKRINATDFSLGYIGTSNASLPSKTVTMTTDVGTAIGFYADLRAVGDTLGLLDNLTIVPERSATALGGFATLGLALRRR